MKRLLIPVSVVAIAFPLTVGSVAAQDLYDCDDFQFQEDAQAILDQNPSDPYGLDGVIGPTPGGIPGVACEDLPTRGGAATTQAPATRPPVSAAQPAGQGQTLPKTGGAPLGSLALFASLITGAGVAVRRLTR